MCADSRRKRKLHLEFLAPELEDSKFCLLLRRLVGRKRGKGRPSKEENERERDDVEALKTVSIDNRLFLQFSMLQEKGHSWNKLRILFGEILKLKEMAYCDIKPLVTTCLRQMASQPQDEAEYFLSTPKDIAWLGPFCKAKGVAKKYLLEEHHDPNFSQMNTLSVGLLLEIATFCDNMSFPGARLLCMLQKVCRADSLQTTESKILLAEVKRLKKEVQKAQKSKGDVEKILQETSRLTPVPTDSTSEQSTHQPSSQEQEVEEQSTVVEVTVQANLPCLCTHDVELRPDPDTELCLHTACANVTGLEEVIEAQKEKIKTLMEALETKERAIAAKAKTILALRASLKGTKDNLDRTKQKLKEKCKECAEEKSSALYQRNYRRKLKLDKQEADIKTRQALQQEVEEERRLKRKAQNQASDANRKRKRMEAELSEARESVQHMEDQVAAAEVATQTRLPSGQFSNSIVKCAIELIGECMVPIRRCRDVIKTVSKHLFGKTYTNNDLPTKSTLQRFADQGHSLSLMQVSDKVSTNKFDLHCDGTSRNNHHFLGFQVTLEDGTTLSLGFDAIAQETSQKLLDLALSRLMECACLFSPEDSAAQLKEILRNLVAFMSDRASINKKAGKLLEGHIQEQVDPNIQIEFIHCNAHFLLGLSTASEKALVLTAKGRGLHGNLGRDSIQVFHSFKASSTESAACRYIRMACDTLGPRGDEKNGCHAAWNAVVQTYGLQRSSKITSFRSNRFNNLFEAAAGLTYHRGDVLRFFREDHPPSNLKQQSVYADAQSTEISVMVCALALFYVYVTGPFWVMINSERHFLDQRLFIQPLHEHLQRMVNHPQMLTTDVPPELAASRLQDHVSPVVGATLQHVQDLDETGIELLHHVVTSLAQHFSEVVGKQLGDFLPDGKYGGVPTPEMRDKMKHCHLTNLIGEACFADLDFSMFKHRGAKLFHHATLNMLKRNRTMSSFVETKTAAEQDHLLSRARKLGPQHREASRQQQQIVKSQIQQRAEEQKRERERREEAQRNANEALALKLQQDGGMCLTRGDILALLDKKTTLKDKLESVKTQVRYRKDVLGTRHPSLKLSGTLRNVVSNLITFLEGKAVDWTQDREMEAAVTRCQTQRHSRCQDEEDEDLEEEEEEEEVEQDEEGMEVEALQAEEEEAKDEVEAALDSDFEFQSPGQTVAAFYSDSKGKPSYFIGQVLEVSKDKNAAAVRFMAQKGLANVFKWPESDDIDMELSGKYVFFGDFHLKSAYGRTWSLASEDWKKLQMSWLRYTRQYC